MSIVGTRPPLIGEVSEYELHHRARLTFTYRDYELRCARTGFTTNIGSYDRQYPYTETKYSDFDKFLFSSWKNKPNGKGKDQIQWGVPVD